MIKYEITARQKLVPLPADPEEYSVLNLVDRGREVDFSVLGETGTLEDARNIFNAAASSSEIVGGTIKAAIVELAMVVYEDETAEDFEDIEYLMCKGVPCHWSEQSGYYLGQETTEVIA